jgi:type IV pilus biogenesis/stability protein PilW
LAENLSKKKSYPNNYSSKFSNLKFNTTSLNILCFVIFSLLFSGCATPTLEEIKNAEAHNKLGYSYLSSGRLNEAFIEFQKALKLNPKNKETLNYLGYISARFNKYDDAIAYYKKAISIDPNYSEAMNNLGVVYLDLKNWDEAIKYFKAALSNPLYHTPERAYSSMGYAYYQKGDYRNAEKALKEALIRNPVFPLAMYTLGLVYVKLGDEEAAIEEFKKAIGIVSDFVDAHWELAKVYLSTGQRAKALKHFRVVVEKDENKERRREALKYIERLKY